MTWISDNWNWMLAIVITIFFGIIIFWNIRRYSYFIDNTIRSNPTKQLLLLFFIVFVAFGYFLLIAYLLFHGQSGLWVKIYSLFSQTTGADTVSDPEPTYFKLFSLVVSFVGSIFFSGFLISTFNNTIQRRIESVNKGTVRYKSLKKHDVIIGANELLCPMIRYLATKNIRNRIIVLTNHNPEEIYSKLNEFDKKIRKRVIVYRGIITLTENLELMQINRCERIAILGDNDLTHCDSINISLLQEIEDQIVGTKIKKDCFFLYWNDTFIFNSNLNKDKITIHPFNFYEMTANKLWGYSHISKKLEGDSDFYYQQITKGEISPESKKYVNLIIVGFNAMAIELLKTALKICHFANYKKYTVEVETQITVISENKKDIEKFQSLYDIKKITDINCNFFICSMYSKEEQDKIKELIEPKNAISTIAICSDNSEENYVYSMYLQTMIDKNDVDILVQYETYSKYIHNIIIQNIEPQEEKRINRIIFFGFKNSSLEIRRSFDTASIMNMCLKDLKRNENNINDVFESAFIDKGKEKIIKEWEKLNITKKRILMAYFDTIPSFFDSLNIQLVDGKDIPDKFVFEKIEKYFLDIKQRQFCALSVLISCLEKNKNIKDDWDLSRMFYVKDEDNDSFEPGLLLLLWLYDNKRFNKETQKDEHAPCHVRSIKNGNN